MSDVYKLLDSLAIRYDRQVPIGPMTWYRVGGAAKALVRPDSIEVLASLTDACRDKGVAMYVLGGGANLLVRDGGVDGVVVKLDAPAFTAMRVEGTKVVVGAGHDLAKLVMETARLGLAGLECLAGIPGTIGGAVRMNAGGAFGEIGRCVKRVKVMDREGRIYHRQRSDLVFSYRKSNIVAPFILEVTLQLEERDPEQLRRRVKEIFVRKKDTQPLNMPSAGCVFRNLPELPDHAPEDLPTAAGALIDKAGLKGFRIGGAMVSERHANFIVTDEGCKADDIVALIEHIQKVVKDRFGVELMREVVIWP